MSGRHENASYFREGTIADAVVTPAYTFTARLLHWTTAVLILSMIPLGVVMRMSGADQRRTLSTTCTARSGRALCMIPLAGEPASAATASISPF